VSYGDLLDIFWQSHRPTTPPWSRQYASSVFFHDEAQHEAALASKHRMEAAIGPLYTDVVPYERFYLAEDYHQKYRLRNAPRLYREFRAMYTEPAGFRESTAAARVNGYLDGWGTRADLEAEIASFGLGEEGMALVRDAVPDLRPYHAKAR
jgi:peptide-methionine (S)-S-oxide reductase